MKGFIDKLLSVKPRFIADALIGILTASNAVWVDVGPVHRILICVLVTLASETFFRWLDDRQTKDDDEEVVIDLEEVLERKQRNRNRMFGE